MVVTPEHVAAVQLRTLQGEGGAGQGLVTPASAWLTSSGNAPGPSTHPLACLVCSDVTGPLVQPSEPLVCAADGTPVGGQCAPSHAADVDRWRDLGWFRCHAQEVTHAGTWSYDTGWFSRSSGQLEMSIKRDGVLQGKQVVPAVDAKQSLSFGRRACGRRFGSRRQATCTC